MHRKSFALIGTVALLASLAGCQQPTMEEMMMQPARPIELDRLNAFVGTWEGTMEAKMVSTGETMTGKGTNTVAWDADKWLLVERFEGTMGPKNLKYAGIGIWSWDAPAKKYRLHFFDNFGAVGTGTATFDEAKQIWSMSAKTDYSGHAGVSKGTMKFADPNTMQWEHGEWDGLQLVKFMEMKGTSRRK